VGEPLKCALDAQPFLMLIRKKVLTLIGTLGTIAVVSASTAYFEFAHRYNFGHFVPYGLHVDVLSEEVSIGIPGQRKMYRAELSNFTLLPVKTLVIT
jgi:hypothetical protein